MKNLVYKLQLYATKILYAVLRGLPLSCTTTLAKTVGRLLPYIPVKKRVLNNLKITNFKLSIPEKDFLRQVGTHCTHLALDYAHIKYYASRPELWPIVKGESVLAEVQHSKKGAVFVTAHFANWEMVRLAARAQGTEIAMIYRPFNNSYIDEYAFVLASKAGQPVFRKGPQGLREMIKHIRSGQSVLILVDQRSGGAPKLNFMGQEAETSLAAAELALKFNVPLIPCYSRRSDNMTQFSVIIEQPIKPAEPEKMMQDINDRIECWINQTPEQWFWVHNRWKKR